MTATGIKLKIVRERLDYAERCIGELRALPTGSREEFLADRRNPLSADALLRRTIEALFDTARHILAKGFGIGKLEYREIARESVARELIVEPSTGEAFWRIAGYRNRLIHHYQEITPEELFDIAHHHLPELQAVARELRAAAGRLVSG